MNGMKTQAAITFGKILPLLLVGWFGATTIIDLDNRMLLPVTKEKFWETDELTFEAQGVLDRFEADQAVILIEELHEEIVVSKDMLPVESEAGVWFDIEFKYGTFNVVSIDFEKTRQMRGKVQGLKDMLRGGVGALTVWVIYKAYNDN